MAASNTEIANLALSHLGTAHTIADLETEDSEEARACRMFFSLALDVVLRDVDWRFARKEVSLAQVQAFTPADKMSYTHSYRYPANAVKIRRLLSPLRVDTLETKRPFELGQDGSGKLVFTDAGPGYYYPADAVRAEITVRDLAPEFYPSDFTLTLSYLLASLVAPRLAGADQFNKSQKSLEKYYLMRSVASRADIDEGAQDPPYDSEFIRVRY